MSLLDTTQIGVPQPEREEPEKKEEGERKRDEEREEEKEERIRKEKEQQMRVSQTRKLWNMHDHLLSTTRPRFDTVRGYRKRRCD